MRKYEIFAKILKILLRENCKTRPCLGKLSRKSTKNCDFCADFCENFKVYPFSRKTLTFRENEKSYTYNSRTILLNSAKHFMSCKYSFAKCHVCFAYFKQFWPFL